MYDVLIFKKNMEKELKLNQTCKKTKEKNKPKTSMILICLDLMYEDRATYRNFTTYFKKDHSQPL